MKNMTMTGERTLQTAYGIFGEVALHTAYDTGELESVRLEGRNVLLTHAGELIPAYTETPRRKYKPSVEFHRNGMIRAVALEEQQEVETPIGELPAELVTFYPTGELKRVFPLDGKLSGFWSEEEETELNIPLRFDLGFAAFTAKLSGICFYRDGNIRSITLAPGETVTVSTGCGEIRIRHGFSLYPDGSLESCEPSEPTEIPTPIGPILACDSNAEGIQADSNSLRFAPDGSLAALITESHRIAVQKPDNSFTWYAPTQISPSEEEDDILYGLKIRFEAGKICFGDSEERIAIDESGFTILPFVRTGAPACSPSACKSCSLCRK